MSAKTTKTLKAMTTSEIVLFPVASRAGDIDRCAAELEQLHGEDAVRFWKTECRRLADELSALGLSEDDVREQVLVFQAEVQSAMMKRCQARAISKSRAGHAIKR
ncbi:hypothetical protein FZ934_16205 [Rhizobium grahamii]|uniref:Uncharacterized protein n=1 Tax=Rhizobium grahamii TaxID=1120045 RepID=A0A5Q0C8Q2_9HYPH|nr:MULTISPECIES: DUF6074 family protein [Rhizobium]QFY61803.1 hypothetical protein FZ934_16205 [Rhizobium grahamii]QRM49024.1 hypothetical protein F3Y33_06690 [Rhizobium sp. BG6]